MTVVPASDGYWRRCRYVSHYDADTVRLEVDLGFHTSHESPFRLIGIDAPEIRGVERPAGLEAKAFVGRWFAEVNSSGLKWPLVVHSIRAGKYGRWLGDVWPAPELNPSGSLSDALLEAGFAVPYV